MFSAASDGAPTSVSAPRSWSHGTVAPAARPPAEAGVGGQQERAEPAVLTDLTVRSASPTQTPLELSDGDVFMQGLGVCGRGTQPGQSPAVPGGARPAACRGHTHVPEGAGPGSSALGLVRAGHKSGGWAPAWGKPGARTREGHVCTSRPPPARSSAPPPPQLQQCGGGFFYYQFGVFV